MTHNPIILFPCPVCQTSLKDCQCDHCRAARRRNDVCLCSVCLSAVRSHANSTYTAIPDTEEAGLSVGQQAWLSASRTALNRRLVAKSGVMQ